MTENELPYGDVPGQTHWDGCWRARGHHNCAVREIERLRAAPREPGEAEREAQEKDAADARRWRIVNRNAAWIRRVVDDEERTYLEVRVANGADLSCSALREDAVDGLAASRPDAGEPGKRAKFHPDCTASRCGDPDLAASCRPGMPCYSSPHTHSASRPDAGAPEGERNITHEATADWSGTWHNWIAPFHFCPRCGQSLNWTRGTDAFDRPIISSGHCGIRFGASLQWDGEPELQRHEGRLAAAVNEAIAKNAAPLDESAAAAPEPEGPGGRNDRAELDRLLLDYGHARERVGQWSEKDIQWSTAELKRSMQVAVAIHAHVEKVKREAVEQALHTAASTRSCNFVPAPAPEPEGPGGRNDRAELDRLLKRALNGAMRHGEGVHNATPAECLKCGEAISAIHAHVEKVKREARAGRMRDMDVPTLHKVPKPEPSPAPAPGDAELDRLLRRLRDYAGSEALSNWRGDTAGRFASEQDGNRVAERIHAHVERCVAEAVKEERLMQRGMFVWQRAWDMNHPVPGEASGETQLGDLLDHMLAEHGAAISPTAMSRDERCAHVDLRDSYKADILRLYRAATGEVVGTGYIATSIDGGIDFYAQSWELIGDKLDPIRGLNVLVVRRDKEGVCE